MDPRVSTCPTISLEPHLESNSSGPRNRKRKARALHDEDWEPYKVRITELYVTEALSLERVKEILGEDGFHPTIRQYKSRIRHWGIDKNVKSDEMKAIVRKRQHRKLIDTDKPELSFKVRGIQVEPRKIDRWMKENSVPDSMLYAPPSNPGTPSALSCYTVSAPGTPKDHDIVAEPEEIVNSTNRDLEVVSSANYPSFLATSSDREPFKSIISCHPKHRSHLVSFAFENLIKLLTSKSETSELVSVIVSNDLVQYRESYPDMFKIREWHYEVMGSQYWFKTWSALEKVSSGAMIFTARCFIIGPERNCGWDALVSLQTFAAGTLWIRQHLHRIRNCNSHAPLEGFLSDFNRDPPLSFLFSGVPTESIDEPTVNVGRILPSEDVLRICID